MNLSKLFATQKVLRDRINYSESDRFDKLILALLVELGECANEWRGFKFWSKDQEPRRIKECGFCSGEGNGFFSGSQYTGYKEKCIACDGTGLDKNKNPLLEEYVDGLHFVLELGIELGYESIRIKPHLTVYREKTISKQFIFVSNFASRISDEDHYDYLYLTNAFLVLGEMLGFTWEQIEQAYFAKNEINHQRQENGY